MTDKIRPPWTPEQVAALNEFQRRGGMHPFTCGGDHAPGSPSLIAREGGWHCPQPYGEPCDYTQDWAHAFMADPGAWPQPPFGERHGPTPDEAQASISNDTSHLHRLRDQLAAELDKARRADQHPRPDLEHVHVTPHNGIAAGLEIALFLVGHHLREAGERTVRTTLDNSVTSADAADNSLREAEVDSGSSIADCAKTDCVGEGQ